MATYDEVMTALRNADKAGDKEAATRLAQIASQMAGQAKKVDYGFGSAMLQGLSFGFSDEAQAKAMEAAGQGTYEENLKAIQVAKEAYEKEYPYRSALAEITGSVPLMFAGGAGGLKALDVGRRILPMITKVPRSVGATGGAAGSGAVTGAITGAGTAQPGERIEGAKTGAKIGAVLGPAGLGAAKTVGVVAPKVPGVSQAIEFGKKAVGLPTDFARRADVKLLQALQRDGIDLNEAMRRVTLIKQGGYKPETIIELGGENTRRLADIVAQYPGASQAARELAESRGAGAPQRIIQDFREAFRVNADAVDLSDQIIRQRDAASKPLYQQAYREGGVIDDPRIMGFMKLDAFKDAYSRARRIAAYDGIELPADPTKMGQVGGFDLMTLDYIKRGLDDVLFTGKQPGSGIGKTELGKLKQKRNEFVGVIDEVGPASYKAARQAFAGPTEVVDAIEQGRKFANLDSREIARIYKGLSPAEQEGFKVGVFDTIQANIQKGADGSDVLRRVWGSPEKRAQLSVFLGDDALMDLTARLEREKVIRATDVRMIGGSQTQPRTLAQREFEGQDELIPQMMDRGVLGGLRNYALRTMTGPGQPTAEQLAKTLYSLDLPTQQAAIQRLQSLDEILARAAARSAGVAGTAGGTSGLLGD